MLSICKFICSKVMLEFFLTTTEVLFVYYAQEVLNKITYTEFLFYEVIKFRILFSTWSVSSVQHLKVFQEINIFMA